MIIYEHNKNAYEKVKEAWQTVNRTCVVHPTGTGKMYIALQLIMDNADKHILFLTSYKSILSQLRVTFNENDLDIDSYSGLSTDIYFNLNADNCKQKFDFIILDEFHRCGAEIWGDFIALLLASNPDAKILGLSATPVRYLDSNKDMADELFDNNIASYMSLAESVALGILAMPKYISCLYSLNDEVIRTQQKINAAKDPKSKDNAQKLLDKAKHLLENAEGLPEIFSRHITSKTGKYIIFCSNIEHMEKMVDESANWFYKVNPHQSIYKIHTRNSPSKNDLTLSEFRENNDDSIKLLFTIDMLNEGLHVNDVDGVIMLRPTVSGNVFLQQLGRALSAGKKDSSVIVDIVNNVACTTQIEGFRDTVCQFVSENSLSVNDFSIIDEMKDFLDIIRDINENLILTWNDWHAFAQDYYLEHGDSFIPIRYITPDGCTLGRWIRDQRIRFKTGKMPAEQVLKLDNLNMVWDVRDLKWEEGFSRAVQYYKKNGNLIIPIRYIFSDGFLLGNWIAVQRIAYKNNTISNERVCRLNSIDMVWDLSVDVLWRKAFAHAKQYYDEFGDLNARGDYISSDGYALGPWLKKERYLHNKGCLSPYKIEKLDSLSMTWNARQYSSAIAWEKGFGYAQNYYLENNNLLMSFRYVSEDGYPLGKWICAQRQVYKNSERYTPLSQAQIRRIESIGMVWDMSIDVRWEAGYAQAKKYFDGHGNIHVSSRYIDDDSFRLGGWVYFQRHHCDTLNQNQVNKLNQIGMDWLGKPA